VSKVLIDANVEFLSDLMLTLEEFVRNGRHPEEADFPEYGFSVEGWSHIKSTRWIVTKLSRDFKVIEFQVEQTGLTYKDFKELAEGSDFDVSSRNEAVELLRSDEDLTELHNAIMSWYFDREFGGQSFQGSFSDSDGNEWWLGFGTFEQIDDFAETGGELKYASITLAKQ
jgi:hypothetical protein